MPRAKGQKFPSDPLPQAPSAARARLEQTIAELQERLVALKARERHKAELREFVRTRALVRKDLLEVARELPAKPPLVLGNGHDTDRRPRGKRLPRYANPADPSQTWSGWSRMPRWASKLTGGDKRKMVKYLIKP